MKNPGSRWGGVAATAVMPVALTPLNWFRVIGQSWRACSFSSHSSPVLCPHTHSCRCELGRCWKALGPSLMITPHTQDQEGCADGCGATACSHLLHDEILGISSGCCSISNVLPLKVKHQTPGSTCHLEVVSTQVLDLCLDHVWCWVLTCSQAQ